MVFSRFVSPFVKFFRNLDCEDKAMITGSLAGSVGTILYINQDALLQKESTLIKASATTVGGMLGAGFCLVNAIFFPHLQIFLSVPFAIGVVGSKMA